jgi:hypothetical protein
LLSSDEAFLNDCDDYYDQDDEDHGVISDYEGLFSQTDSHFNHCDMNMKEKEKEKGKGKGKGKGKQRANLDYNFNHNDQLDQRHASVKMLNDTLEKLVSLF